MKQYQDLLQDILDNGREKESGRANMPNTLGLSRGTILMQDVQEYFPLLTTKKMFWKGVVHELLWFLRGETNIKYLVDNNVNIWNGDAYRWYLKHYDNVKDEYKLTDEDEPYSMEEFIKLIKDNELTEKTITTRNSNYKLGDLGKVYGYQWRNQNGVDQIADIMKDLKENPYGRYKILDGWNKRDFPEMALPPCHLLYQFIVRPMTLQERIEIYANQEGQTYGEFIRNWDTDEQWIDDLNYADIPKYYLDLNMYQRSCDTFLGVPFNLASMSLLLLIMAKANNMVAGDAFWIGGDTHIYVDHVDVVKQQISREPMELPKMKILRELNSLEDILELTIDDFKLLGYESHDKLKAELFTGLKKK
jgi:thymidylate synthase